MRNTIFIILILLQFSCNNSTIDYTQTILENKTINTDFLNSIEAPEKALLSWYLFAYGNECIPQSEKVKCNLLKLLEIEDECSEAHISYLKKWFSSDVIIRMKLRKCPNLSYASVTQNSIKKIVLQRRSDTLSIIFKVSGMNTLQEKFWNIEQEEFFLIKRSELIKINR